MRSENNINNKYLKAKKRVEDIKGFYGNLISYCLVIPMLVLLNYYTSWEAHKWFVYPMIFWGIGLFIHGFNVFGFGKNWEERKIRELMDNDKF